jgi:hypothetical protein
MIIENIPVLQQTDTTILRDAKEYKGNISCAHVAKNLIEIINLHNNRDYNPKLLDNKHWIEFAKTIGSENIKKCIDSSQITDISFWSFLGYKNRIICEKYSDPCQIDIKNWEKLARFKYKLLDYLYYVLICGENFILYITQYNDKGECITYIYITLIMR